MRQSDNRSTNTKYYVDGLNVRTMVEDLGYLILKNGLYHLIKGWKGPSSPINFSDVRLIFPA